MQLPQIKEPGTFLLTDTLKFQEMGGIVETTRGTYCDHDGCARYWLLLNFFVLWVPQHNQTIMLAPQAETEQFGSTLLLVHIRPVIVKSRNMTSQEAMVRLQAFCVHIL